MRSEAGYLLHGGIVFFVNSIICVWRFYFIRGANSDFLRGMLARIYVLAGVISSARMIVLMQFLGVNNCARGSFSR